MNFKMFFLVLLVLILAINVVNADNSTVNSTLNTQNDLQTDNVQTEFVVSSDNVSSYFDDEGVLDSSYENSNLVFEGEFENLGTLSIASSNVSVYAENAKFNNVAFGIYGENVTLSNLHMVLNESSWYNEYAGILICADNAVVKNSFINFTAPVEQTAYAIFSSGSSNGVVNNFQLLNNTIYFEANNIYSKSWNYAVKCLYSPNAVIKGNYINTSMPLRAVNWNIIEAIDMDLVLTVGAQYCNNLILADNELYTEVKEIGGEIYPTLDCVLIHSSDNCIISGNNITEIDFATPRGIDNYLYGIDVYSLKNLTITHNNVNISTNGGKLKEGTAYPIQVTGPISDIEICYNNLTTRSNGPNLGIYSQNYYGDTALNIHHNNINVSGLAGTDSWSLVSGIEVQDTSDVIMNNLLINFFQII